MMVKNSALIRTSSFLLLALAMLILSALFVMSEVSPALAGSGDSDGPECLSYVPVTGDARIKVTFRDTNSGLAEVDPVAHKNVNNPLVIPAFDPGWTNGVTATIEVSDPGSNARVGMRGTDMAGNSTWCVGNYFAP